ncbi:MAG TPA: MraY family glycosyltransferase [Flavobacteriales bacterium]
MREHNYILLLGFFTAFVVVLFTMPSLIKVARRKHLVDEPKEDRKLHQRSIPTIGGILIFASILFSYSLWFPQARLADVGPESYLPLYKEMGLAYKDFKFVIATMVLLFFIGVKDDIIGFSPMKKLIGHLIVGYILVVMGDVRIRDMHGILSVYELPYWVSVGFSFFTYLVLVNAFNLIDGVDGLAATIGLISAASYGLWLYWAGDVALSLLAFTLAGALVGFLVFNWNPARIFMGDSGSLIIGAVISVLAMRIVDHDVSRLPVWLRTVPAPLFAMAAIAYPLVDTFRIFFVRAARGVSPFSADRNHIHHRLMAMGLGHKGTVLALAAYALTLIALSLLTRDILPNKGLFILGSTALVLSLLPFALSYNRPK